MTPDRAPMVTLAERKLLAFLSRYEAFGPVRPSYRDMADALGFPSVGSVAHLITQLEKRGFVRRIPGRSRSVEVLLKPERPLLLPARKIAEVEAMLGAELVRKRPGLAERIVEAVLAS